MHSSSLSPQYNTGLLFRFPSVKKFTTTCWTQGAPSVYLRSGGRRANEALYSAVRRCAAASHRQRVSEPVVWTLPRRVGV